MSVVSLSLSGFPFQFFLERSTELPYKSFRRTVGWLLKRGRILCRKIQSQQQAGCMSQDTRKAPCSNSE